MFHQAAFSDVSFPPIPYPLAHSVDGGLPSLKLPLHLSNQQYRTALKSMLSRGHGLETISTCLAIEREEVLDLAVHSDLATPHDRPVRKNGSVHAWLANDCALLVLGYFANWRYASIGERLGRSPGSVRSKLRWLGLPLRPRVNLTSPALQQLDLPLPLCVPPLALDQVVVRNRKRSEWVVTASEKPLVVRWKRQGKEIAWTPELSRELAMRRWSNQRTAAVALDFGVPTSAISSHLYWLQIPALPRKAMTDVYRPETAAENIAAFRFEEKKCVKSEFTYWRSRTLRNHSRRDIAAGLYD